jgi:hypothetical protein
MIDEERIAKLEADVMRIEGSRIKALEHRIRRLEDGRHARYCSECNGITLQEFREGDWRCPHTPCDCAGSKWRK